LRGGHVMTGFRGIISLCLGLTLSPIAFAQDIPKRSINPNILSGGINAQDLERLSDLDMQRAFSGRTMHGVYKNPRERSGSQFFSEDFLKDGSTLYKEGDISDTGMWSTRNDRLCFDYSGPLSGNISCFAVYRIGTCYYSYSTNEILNGKPLIPNAWSVKSKLDGDLSTCEDLMS